MKSWYRIVLFVVLGILVVMAVAMTVSANFYGKEESSNTTKKTLMASSILFSISAIVFGLLIYNIQSVDSKLVRREVEEFVKEALKEVPASS